MKNILRKILIIFMLLVLSISAISLAANEADSEASVNYDDQVVPISLEDDMPVETSSEKEQTTISKNYFYAGTEDLNITTPVLGDVFIVTSGKVVINTSIYGNVFICASSVELAEEAEIQSSLFNTSNSLNITGIVGNNVYSVSKDFTLSGTVENDVFLTSNNFSANGTVYGDLNVADTEEDTSSFEISSFVFSIVSFIIFALVIFAISKWLNCKFINNYPDFVKDLPKSLLFGFLGLIVTPVLCIILLMLGVTVSLSFILMAIYMIMLLISSSVVIITLSKLAADKLQIKFEKSNSTLLTVLSIIVLSIVYKLLQLIPTLGVIITFAFVLVGFGFFIKNVVPSKNKSQDIQ